MNSSFIHADIFFYITSISVVVLTIMLIVVLFYIARIAKHIEHASRKISEESDRIIEDVSMIRESIEEHGSRAMSFFKFIFGSFIRPSKVGSRSSAKAKRNAKNKHRNDETADMDGE